jgi:hypothetical protein
MMRLIVDGGLPIAGGIIGTGGELLWTAPVRPGDTLRVECEVLEITPSRSKPDRGTVRVRCITLNQHGEMVQSFTPKLVVPRRAKEEPRMNTDAHGCGARRRAPQSSRNSGAGRSWIAGFPRLPARG